MSFIVWLLSCKLHWKMLEKNRKGSHLSNLPTQLFYIKLEMNSA